MPASPPALVVSGPATPECLDRIHDALDQLWDAAPAVAELDRNMFATALLEVAGNTLAHGGGGVSFSLELRAGDDEVRADFSDDGPAVTLQADAALPEDDFAEHGRGLVMARVALTTFEHHHADGRNHWLLARRLTG